MDISSDEMIFVYGTLRKDGTNPLSELFIADCEFIAFASLKGILYEINGYPGYVEPDDSDGIVHGELYRLKDAEKMLDRVDDYEECSDKFSFLHEYTRQKRQVLTTDGQFVSAWVYIYELPVTGLRYIKSGDYIKG